MQQANKSGNSWITSEKCDLSYWRWRITTPSFPCAILCCSFNRLWLS